MASPGLILLAPKKDVLQTGPMIIDGNGELVWFKPLDTKGITDFRVQSYGGKPVLTWWRGKAVKGVGDGYYVILDDSYREIARVYAGNGLRGDVHDFLITAEDTALITIYRRLPQDLSAIGGPKRSSIWEGVIQEVDIPSGKVLWEWHSADEIEPSESYTKPPPPTASPKGSPYDYFHINSVDVQPDGSLLISARNTHGVYEISRPEGRVVWRLGGKKSDFKMGKGTTFAWQHDARRQPDGTITIFDNSADPKTAEFSRVLVLDVDTETERATLLRSYAHPKKLLAGSQGNAQFLPDGHVFVGWGAKPYFTEFDADGTVLLDGRIAAGPDNYRAYRAAWAGRPTDNPALAATREDGTLTVSASWNGATDVVSWQVLAGEDLGHLESLTSAVKDGFETEIVVETEHPFLQVRALSASGTVLGTSRLVETPAAG